MMMSWRSSRTPSANGWRGCWRPSPWPATPSRSGEEIEELLELAEEAKAVETSGSESKLAHLREIMQEEGVFDRPDQRLLLFTEFKDTLDHLLAQLKAWGFRTGCIHGGMRPGSRDEPGSRLHTEQQFREGEIQVLVATEAAGEGINLQCCHILFNYDIPWNPNRLEQRMGPHPSLRTAARLPHLQLRRNQHHRRAGAPAPARQAAGDPRRPR